MDMVVVARLSYIHKCHSTSHWCIYKRRAPLKSLDMIGELYRQEPESCQHHQPCYGQNSRCPLPLRLCQTCTPKYIHFGRLISTHAGTVHRSMEECFRNPSLHAKVNQVWHRQHRIYLLLHKARRRTAVPMGIQSK